MAPSGELGEEVVALVVDDDEGGEVGHLDAPDRLHAEFGIFDHLDLLDAVLGEPSRRPADRAEIEAAMLLAGLAYFGAAIAFGQGDEAAASRHELIDIGIHPPCRARPERARRVARPRLARARGLERVMPYVLRP